MAFCQTKLQISYIVIIMYNVYAYMKPVAFPEEAPRPPPRVRVIDVVAIAARHAYRARRITGQPFTSFRTEYRVIYVGLLWKSRKL